MAISFGHFFGHFNFPIFGKKVIQVANPNRAQFTKCASYAIPSTTVDGQTDEKRNGATGLLAPSQTLVWLVTLGMKDCVTNQKRVHEGRLQDSEGRANRPFPSCCQPHYESETRCTAFLILFIIKTLHLASLS